MSSSWTDEKAKVNKNVVDTDFGKTVDEKAEKALLEMEKQKLVTVLNRSIQPNYMKITNWKDYDKLGTYTDTNTTFFALEFAPNTSDAALADYDIRILKWSEDEESFATKSQLYKDKTKNLLLNMLKEGEKGKLIKNGVVWTIRKNGKNNYKIDFLWDYIYDKYGSSKNISATTAGKVALLRDYFNFWNIYLTKNPDDFEKILNEVDKELNDKKFTELTSVIKKIYFKKTK